MICMPLLHACMYTCLYTSTLACLAPPLARPPRPPVAAYVVVAVADLATTVWAEHRGAVEANPAMRCGWLARAALKATATTVVLVVDRALVRRHPGAARWLRRIVLTGLGAVAVRNAYQAARR